MGDYKIDANRNAVGPTFITEVAKGPDGGFFNKVVKKVDSVDQTLEPGQGGVRQDGTRLARQPELPLMWHR